MADVMPISPPGSWPDTTDSHNDNSDVRPYSGLGMETVKNAGQGISKGNEGNNLVKRKELLPPEILEQYARTFIKCLLGLLTIRRTQEPRLTWRPLQDSVSYRPRDIRVAGASKLMLAQGISDAPSIRPSSVKMSLILYQQ